MLYLKLTFRASEDNMADGLQNFCRIEDDSAAQVGQSGRRNDVA